MPNRVCPILDEDANDYKRPSSCDRFGNQKTLPAPYHRHSLHLRTTFEGIIKPFENEYGNCVLDSTEGYWQAGALRVVNALDATAIAALHWGWSGLPLKFSTMFKGEAQTKRIGIVIGHGKPNGTAVDFSGLCINFVDKKWQKLAGYNPVTHVFTWTDIDPATEYLPSADNVARLAWNLMEVELGGTVSGIEIPWAYLNAGSGVGYGLGGIAVNCPKVGVTMAWGDEAVKVFLFAEGEVNGKGAWFGDFMVSEGRSTTAPAW